MKTRNLFSAWDSRGQQCLLVHQCCISTSTFLDEKCLLRFPLPVFIFLPYDFETPCIIYVCLFFSEFYIKMLSCYLTILILGFISSVCMETCPEPEDLYPCKCSENDLSSEEITAECLGGYDLESNIPLNVLQPVLSHLRGKKVRRLILYNVQDTLPSNLFTGISITTLELYFCPMDSFAKDDQPRLLGLEDHLEVRYFVVFPYSKLNHSYSQWNLFWCCSLQALRLGENPIDGSLRIDNIHIYMLK